MRRIAGFMLLAIIMLVLIFKTETTQIEQVEAICKQLYGQEARRLSQRECVLPNGEIRGFSR